MTRVLRIAVVVICAQALALPFARAEEEELLIEEVIVEAPFDVRLELPKQSAVQIMIDRLTLDAETRRAQELQIANRSPLTTILDLTKYSPIPISDTGSGRSVDPFFLQNYMRADLNPPKDDPLRLNESR